MLHKHQTVIQASDCFTSFRLLNKHRISVQASDHHIISSDHHIISSDQHIIIFFRASGWHWETCTQIRYPKIIKMGLSGVQVAPFRPKRTHLDPIRAHAYVLLVPHFWTCLPMSAWGSEKNHDMLIWWYNTMIWWYDDWWYDMMLWWNDMMVWWCDMIW